MAQTVVTAPHTVELIGALTGLVFGMLSASFVGTFYQETIVSPESVFTAVANATAMGLFFRVYPARRASRLKPIDALRYE